MKLLEHLYPGSRVISFSGATIGTGHPANPGRLRGVTESIPPAAWSVTYIVAAITKRGNIKGKPSPLLDTTNCSRAIGCLTVLLGLLLACSTTACNGGPTRPSPEDRVRLYPGRWSGTINGLEVLLDMQSGLGDLIGLDGTGTARNPATGEIHRLRISGFGTFNDAHGTANFDLWAAPYEIHPGILTGGQHTGQFRGNVSLDGRTWPGHWTPTNHSDGARIFGPGEHRVTLIKE